LSYLYHKNKFEPIENVQLEKNFEISTLILSKGEVKSNVSLY